MRKGQHLNFSDKPKNEKLQELSSRGRLHPKKVILEPTMAMSKFNESLKKYTGHESESELIIDNDLLCVHGVLSPMGKLYPCQYGNHTQLSDALGYKQQYDLESSGFVTLSRMIWRVEPRFTSRKPTREQWKVIESWYLDNGFSRNDFLDLKEKAEY